MTRSLEAVEYYKFCTPNSGGTQQFTLVKKRRTSKEWNFYTIIFSERPIIVTTKNTSIILKISPQGDKIQQ